MTVHKHSARLALAAAVSFALAAAAPAIEFGGFVDNNSKITGQRFGAEKKTQLQKYSEWLQKTTGKTFRQSLPTNVQTLISEYENASGETLDFGTKQALKAFKLDQRNKAGVWFKAPFSDDGMTYLAVQGSYEHDYNFRDKKSGNYVDLDLCKFNLVRDIGEDQFSVAAGRFFVSDVSGVVYAQNADGVYASFDRTTVNFAFYGAYTGLLNANTTTMISHEGNDMFVADQDKWYDLAEKYIVTAATATFPAVGEKHTFSAQFLGAVRAEHKEFNRFYGSVALSGELTPSLYYNSDATFGFVNYDHSSYAKDALLKADVTYYLPFKSATIGGNVVYATETFMGFTSQTAVDSWSEPEYTDLFKPGIAFTIKPVNPVLLSFTTDLVYDSELEYHGFQYHASANWQATSDLYIGGVFYQYFDKDDETNRKTCFQLKATLTF